jgi:DNA-binding protein H-NS
VPFAFVLYCANFSEDAMARSYEDLLRRIRELQEQADAMRKREAAGVIKRIREAIAEYKLTPADLFEGQAVSKKPRKKPTKPVVRKERAVKYADKKGNTWKGGGSMPIWLREYVEAGHDIEEFRVKKEKHG